MRVAHGLFHSQPWLRQCLTRGLSVGSVGREAVHLDIARELQSFDGLFPGLALRVASSTLNISLQTHLIALSDGCRESAGSRNLLQ